MKGTEIAAPMGGAFPQGRAGKEGHPSLAVASTLPALMKY
jgi:hypothetical protein